jgi:hypothetical protein
MVSAVVGIAAVFQLQRDARPLKGPVRGTSTGRVPFDWESASRVDLNVLLRRILPRDTRRNEGYLLRSPRSAKQSDEVLIVCAEINLRVHPVVCHCHLQEHERPSPAQSGHPG